MKPREIIGRIEAKFNVQISYMKAWDARWKALRMIFGSWEESYNSLFHFMETIKLAMPGTVYVIKYNSVCRFNSLF